MTSNTIQLSRNPRGPAAATLRSHSEITMSTDGFYAGQTSVLDTNQATTTLDAMAPAQAQSSAPEASPHAGMVWIPGGTFRMGSDDHYLEEAPVHRVTVAPFWIDRAPVTNRDFLNFVRATRYVTFAEIPPDPNDYPGALRSMLKAGSLAFNPPKHAVDKSEWNQWWTFKFGATWKRLG